MSRRFRYTFILILVAIGTGLAAVSGWRYARASAPVNGPILVISIDSLRADHLGAYGYRTIATPAIDTLAKDGVVFERAYSQVPQTLPSHVALLTGRLPFETGVRDGVGVTVPASERLLPEMLRDRGYSTAGVVSTLLLRKETGINQGFTFFDGEMPAADPTAGAAPGGLQRDGAASERLAEQWLDSVGTTRAFLFLHLDEPRVIAGGTAPGSSYDTRVLHADEVVGRLLRYLKTHQLYDQSTVILLSDHGEGLGDHGEQGHGVLVYDNTLRVPLIIKQPAGEGAGLRVRTPVQLIDLVPTILDLAKAPRPGNLSGRSLTPLLERGGETPSDAPIYSESMFAFQHFGWSTLASIIKGPYSYIEGAKPELYNLETDPGQRENLADARKDMVSALREELRGLTATPATVLEPEVVSDSIREQFGALGYVGVPQQPSPPRSDVIDPNDRLDVVEQYREGVAFAAAKDWERAIERFRALTRRDLDMPDVWMMLGRTASQSERWEVAVEAYRRAAQLAPTNPDGFLGSASALLALRKFDEAGQQARHVVDDQEASAAQHSIAHEILARAALGRRNPELARSEAELAEVDGQRPVKAYVEGRIAFDQRRFDDAVESFDAALGIIGRNRDSPLADLRLYAAEALLRLNRYPEAEALLLEEMNASPTARARAGLMAVYRATGRGPQAAALAQR